MFGIKSNQLKSDGIIQRLNNKIKELEEFVAISGQYRSDYEIKKAKVFLQELKYIKTGRKK